MPVVALQDITKPALPKSVGKKLQAGESIYFSDAAAHKSKRRGCV